MNENNYNIDENKYNNVKQPRVAMAVIKLREAYCDFMKEADRGKKEYGAISDQDLDKFVNQYIDITRIMTCTMARIMECEVNEAIDGNI